MNALTDEMITREVQSVWSAISIRPGRVAWKHNIDNKDTDVVGMVVGTKYIEIGLGKPERAMSIAELSERIIVPALHLLRSHLEVA